MAPQPLEIAFCYSHSEYWFGVRPTNTERARIIFHEEAEGYAYNEFITTNLTAHIQELFIEPFHDEVIAQVTLQSRRNTISNTSAYLNAFKIRIHSYNDVNASVVFLKEYFSGDNIRLRAAEVVNAWLGDEAWVRVPCEAESGVKPINASLTILFRWRLHDSIRNLQHHLNITAEVHYTESLYEKDIWIIPTSVELDLIPGSFVAAWNFEGLTLGEWDAWDNDSRNGYDYWGIVTRRSYDGRQSAWCVGTSDGTQGSGLYDNYMNTYMQIDFPTLVSYDKLYLYFKAWIETEESRDYFSVEYYDINSSSWKIAATYHGLTSTSPLLTNTVYNKWLSIRIELPTSATKLRFRFYSDDEVVYEGAYLDHILLFATY